MGPGQDLPFMGHQKPSKPWMWQKRVAEALQSEALPSPNQAGLGSFIYLKKSCIQQIFGLISPALAPQLGGSGQ